MKKTIHTTVATPPPLFSSPSFGGGWGEAGAGGRIKTILLTILLCQLTATAQSSWQWAKTGGSSSLTSPYEGVYSIVTDSQKNSYILSRVGYSNLNVDGHPKQSYDNPASSNFDIMLASFACDGSYRWSKVIGGKNNQTVNGLQIDGQDNIYISGGLSCGNATYPPRIENDVIYPQTPVYDCRIIFLAKFNSNGIMQWINRPQPTTSTVGVASGTFGLETDTAGNSYQLVCVAQGLYAGVFTNNLTNSNLYGANSSWFVFKYDTNGNFVSGTPLDIQCTNISALKFFRNPNNGNYYITGERDDTTWFITIGGQSITKSRFLACFNSTGAFQWKKEDTYVQNGSSGTNIYGMTFDNQNNMYIGLFIIGSNADTFLGYSVAEILGGNSVIKVDANANTLIWGSHDTSTISPSNIGAIAINGNEIVYTNIGGNVQTWGSQTITGYNGQQILLARFNKDTGACLGLSFLPNNHTGPDKNFGAALAVDVSGDILLGGGFETALYLTNGTQILNNGAVDTDFFIAKYAPQACSPLATESFESQDKRLLIAPNPATDKVEVKYEFKEVFSNKTIEIVDMLGRTLLNLKINDMKGTANIDCSKYTAGQYVIALKENGIVVGNSKLLVE